MELTPGIGGWRVSVQVDDVSSFELVREFFAPWWSTDAHDHTTVHSVVGSVDPAAVGFARKMVLMSGAERVFPFELTQGLRSESGHDVFVWCGTRSVAYHHDRREATTYVWAENPTDLALDVFRFARNLVADQLEMEGWVGLHAAALDAEGRGVLAIGDKGAGKTTTALLMAQLGAGLVANDKCFVKPIDAALPVLPWPETVAIGLGLVEALGWRRPILERIHLWPVDPVQVPEVAHQLASGTGEAIRRAGREEKLRLFGTALQSLGLLLSPSTTAALVIHPRLASGRAVVSLRPHLRTGPDPVTGLEEYPNVMRHERASFRSLSTAIEAALESVRELPRLDLPLRAAARADRAAVSALLERLRRPGCDLP